MHVFRSQIFAELTKIALAYQKVSPHHEKLATHLVELVEIPDAPDDERGGNGWEEARQLRHHFGTLSHAFLSSTPPHTWYTLLSVRAYWMPAGACDPLLWPIHVFRSGGRRWTICHQ